MRGTASRWAGLRDRQEALQHRAELPKAGTLHLHLQKEMVCEGTKDRCQHSPGVEGLGAGGPHRTRQGASTVPEVASSIRVTVA